MARRKTPRRIVWAVILCALREGRKVTEASLHEADHCTDGSEFVICPDHPRGPNRPLRLWPR